MPLSPSSNVRRGGRTGELESAGEVEALGVGVGVGVHTMFCWHQS